MKKYIISTTGSNIEFRLNAERLLIIESVIPIEVTEEEFVILQKRLGAQIRLVDTNSTSNISASSKVDLSNIKNTGSTLEEEEEIEEEEEEDI